MEEITTPTKAQTNLFALIRQVNRDSKPVIISGSEEDKHSKLSGEEAIRRNCSFTTFLLE